MVDKHSKVLIYNDEKVLLGNAAIIETPEESIVLLRVADQIMDGLFTSFIVTFTNDVQGILTYRAGIEDFKKESEGSSTYKVKCEMVEMLEAIQRRQNFKVKVTIPVVISLYDNNGKLIINKKSGVPYMCPVEIKDISASGMLFATEKDEMWIGQIIEFMFDKSDPPFPLKAEIIREQDFEDGKKAYGCRFVNLSVAEEASIRRYIFDVQLANNKSHGYSGYSGRRSSGMSL